MAWGKGTRLRDGEYIIEKALGKGGFGITYKARHVMLDEWVVIKTPNQDRQEHPDYPKFVKRFLKEARVLAKLGKVRHPHIVRVSNLFIVKIKGTHSEILELPCLVMDFIEGRSLYQIIKDEGALPENVAVGYIKQICSALAVVHELGLVHRDAHPGNIMIPNNEPEQAILIDFGLVGEVISSTASSKHFANRAFAPHEQEIGSKEPTVDLYTLAASLYYAVTDQLPAMSLGRKLARAPLIPPKEHNPEISDELNEAILWGLELEPENRPQSMRLWLQRLESIPLSNVTSPEPPKPDAIILTADEIVTPPVTPPPVNQKFSPQEREFLEVREVENQERLIPPPEKSPQLSREKQPKQRKKKVPWGWLIGTGVSYAMIGFFSAPWSWAMAMAIGVNLSG